MKKANKIFATVLTLALVFTLPQTTIMSRAEGVGFTGMDGGYAGGIEGSIPEPTSPSSSSSSSSNENSSSASGSYNNDSSSASYSDSGSGASDSGSATVAAPKKNANDITVGTTGGQKFRLVMSKDHTTYQVYHCGNSKATFNVTDAKGNIIPYKSVTLEQGEDKLWYVNITFAEGIDTKDLTVNVLNGDATYLSTTLGVSGIKINGTLALSTVPAESEDAVVGHRTCVCGASFDIRENSGLDENAWNAHAKEHAAKGEAVRWTDK